MSPADEDRRHAPATLSAYRKTHDAFMDGFLSRGIILSNQLDFRVSPGTVEIVGFLGLPGLMVLRVQKQLRMWKQGNQPWVQTYSYCYQASIQGVTGVFRYDNAHTHPGHADAHHRHGWDLTTREQIKPPRWVGQDGWPHLSGVIEEAHQIYLESAPMLGLPDEGPDLSRCRWDDFDDDRF